MRPREQHGTDSANASFESKIALIAEVENAFRALQSALLSRNLEGLRQATRELAGGHEKLNSFEYLNSRKGESQGSEFQGNDTSGSRERVAELRQAERRILQLGRVQAALLGRAQKSLVTLTNMLAGSEIIYGPPARNCTLPMKDTPAGEPPCRV
jgi:hypothetical protein